MISDQQLATREREIAKLFLGLRTTTQEQAGRTATPGEVDQQVPTPAQRIQQILRRAEEERDDDRHNRSADSPQRSMRGQYRSD